MKLRTGLIPIISILCAQPILSYTNDSLVVVLREYTEQTVNVGDTIGIRLHVYNNETSALAGFFLSDQIPPEFDVISSSVKIGGSIVDDHLYETGEPGEVYDASIPHRWAFEIPPEFTESNPIPPGDSAAVEYELACTLSGTYVFRNFSWAGTIIDVGDTLHLFGYDDDSLTIVVNQVNHPPLLDSIGHRTVVEGDTLSFTVTSSDVDGDPLSLNADPLPLHASFTDNGDGTGHFRFTPDYVQAGGYPLTFVSSDGAAADSELVTITVAEAGNQPPVLDSIGAQTVVEGDTLILTITSSDPDLDSLVLTAAPLPTNATLIDNGNGTADFSFIPDYMQAGEYHVTFVVRDTALADSEIVEIEVTQSDNTTPVLDSIGAQVVDEGDTLAFQVRASDIDGDSLILSALPLPTNASFADSGDGTGNFLFIPDYYQAGDYRLFFVAADSALADSEEVLISVIHVNLAPVLDSIGPKNVEEGDSLRFTVTAGDPDGDSLLLYTIDAPENSQFTDNGDGTGDFSFTPDHDQSGAYSISFVVDDGYLQDVELVAVEVYERNQPPVLDSIGQRYVAEGDTLAFQVIARDGDPDPLFLSAAPLPSNASFNDNGDGTGDFFFTPDFTQEGSYEVNFVVRDTALADSELVAVIVMDASNQPPVLDSIGPRTVTEGDTLTLAITGSDPDHNPIMLSGAPLPPNASFTDNGDGSADFQFVPDFTQAGSHGITFTVSDGLLADSELVAITVLEWGNHPPILDSIGPKTVVEGNTLSFTVASSDVDGDSLALIAYPIPPNASFTDNGNGTGHFSFTPDYTQTGLYDVTFVVQDTSLLDTEVITITVMDAGNHPPVLDSIGSATISGGDTLTLSITASDPDGDSLTLSAAPLPGNAFFVDNGDGTGTFMFAPDSIQIERYEILFVASDASLADSELVSIQITRVEVTEDSIVPTRATRYSLEIHPNPFTRSAMIEYCLASDSRVLLRIYNTAGQEVCAVIDDLKPAGFHALVWGGRDNIGRPTPAGHYFLRIEAYPVSGSQEYTATKKIALVR